MKFYLSECELSPIVDTSVPIICDCVDKEKKGTCFPSIQSSLIGQNFFCRGNL